MNILNFILNHQDYLEDLITRSTYHSNGIEGSTLTYAETYAILYNDNSFKIQGKEDRVKYFEYLKNNDITNFAEWLMKLSKKENKVSYREQKAPSS